MVCGQPLRIARRLHVHLAGGVATQALALRSSGRYLGSEAAGASFDGSAAARPAWREQGPGGVGFGGSSAGPAAVAGAGAGAAVAFDGSPPAAGAVALPGTVAVLASPFAVESPFFLLCPFPFEILMGTLVVAADHLGTYFSPCASKWCKKAPPRSCRMPSA